MSYRCEKCGREWDSESAADNEYYCTRRCGGQLVPVGQPSADGTGLGRLPSVVAIPLLDYQAEAGHPVMQLHRLCDAAEILTRFLTITALGELRCRLGDGPLPEDLLKSLQPRIERPTFGQWRDMLSTLIAVLEKADDLVLPGLLPLSAYLISALEGGSALPEQSLLALRNQLAHGGGMTRAAANELLERWRPWMEELLRRMAFLEEAQVCSVRDGTPLCMAGCLPEAALIEAPDSLREPLRDLEGHVVLSSGGRWLDLWPLCDYGRAATATLQGRREALAESPLVYMRAESDRLFYAALGTDLPRAEKHDAVAEFQRLFRITARIEATKDQALDFEDEIRADSQALLGREDEIRQAKELIRETSSGVLWLDGPGGSGKSFLMARLAADLGNAPDRLCRIAWRFKAGDAARCSRGAFFRHAVQRLTAWGQLGGDGAPPAADPEALYKQLEELLGRAAALTAKDPRGRPPRVLFIVDGLDEIERLDPDFPQIPFRLAFPNVVWVCAGRAERTLPQVFTPVSSRHVFPGGLPAMSAQDIRSMLLEDSAALKYELLRRDSEQQDPESGDVRVTNPAVEAVVQRAAGLPLYVHFVLQDLLAAHVRFDELERRLPATLEAYYDDLLRRLAIGDLQALLAPLVVTLAWARSPLDEGTLYRLMVRRKALAEGEQGRKLLRDGLDALQSMVRQAPALGGGTGYEPYHHTFRQHVQEDRAGIVGVQNTLARQEFCDLARDWAQLDEADPARLYALAFGPRHLADEDRAADLETLLTDLRFIQAKCEASLVYDLQADYLAALPQHPNTPTPQHPNTPLQAFATFVATHGHLLARAPGETLTIARNQAADGLVAESAEPLAEALERPWVARDPRPAAVATRSACLRTLAGHYGQVNAIALTPDGKTVVSASADNNLIIWDLASGRPLHYLQGHSGQVYGVAVTPDGRSIISGSLDHTLRIWDLETGQEVRTLEGHSDTVNAVVVAPDGKTALSAGKDTTVRLWDLASGQCLRTLEGHRRGVKAVAVAPDGRTAVSAGADRTLIVWDLESGQALHTLEGHSLSVEAVALTPDGRTAVSGSADGTLIVWDLESGQAIRTLKGHERAVNAVAVTTDGRRAVSAGTDRAVIVWDLESGQALRTFREHSDGAFSIALSPDGETALSGGGFRDPMIRVWDLTADGAARQEAGHRSNVRALALTPDRKLLASAGADGSLICWDFASGEMLRSLKGHERSIRAVAITPDGESILSASRDHVLILWDLESGEPLRPLQAHERGVRAVEITPDGGRAVSAGEDRLLFVWDLETGETLFKLAGHSREVNCVALTPDGRLAVSGSLDAALIVWDLASGELVRRLQGHEGWISRVVLTPDGKQALSAGSDRTLRLWDLASGECLHVFEGHTGAINALALTPDGKRAVSGGLDPILRVWDLASGQPVCTLEGHLWFVNALVVSPDGRLVLSASDDHTVRVWDLEAEKCLALYGATSTVFRLSPITPEGRFACGTSDGQVHFLTLRNWG
jgi:WD40 repeat protein/DNA-directed RNA polymerase subunit RPC12/RpoP